MSIEEIKAVLLWCVGINYVILTVWFGVFVLAHEWIYQIHTRWFKLSVQTFDAIHYAGMAIYKIGIMLFMLAPLVAIMFLNLASK